MCFQDSAAAADPDGDNASGRAGRADGATFAEALQAVDELQSLASESPGMVTGVTDRIEGMLLEHLEAANLEADDDARSVVNDGGAPDLEVICQSTRP